jgi:soluble lytic murein transglycosylase-like protein
MMPSAVSADGNNDPYCFNNAGYEYGVSPLVLWAISKNESNHNPLAVNENKNGSVDFCHMQINSGWIKKIGTQRWENLTDKCFCTKMGAWILADCINRYGNTWKAIGCYHSPTGEIQERYANKISKIIYRNGNN